MNGVQIVFSLYFLVLELFWRWDLGGTGVALAWYSRGRPPCRGGLSSQSVRPSQGLTGEARSRPGVTVAGGPRGSAGAAWTSPMMGDTPSGVVARRTCPSGVASFGRVTHAPADPRALHRATRRSMSHRQGRRPKPQSGFLDGPGSGVAAGGIVQFLDKVADMPGCRSAFAVCEGGR